MPNAEVLATGTELLSGDVVDTNSARIARALQSLSIPLVQITVVGMIYPAWWPPSRRRWPGARSSSSAGVWALRWTM